MVSCDIETEAAPAASDASAASAAPTTESAAASSMDVELCVDVRERALLSELPRHLSIMLHQQTCRRTPPPPVNLRTAALSVGDVHVVTTCQKTATRRVWLVVERKTVADLCASIVDGRYREQLARMRSAGLPASSLLYVLEGGDGVSFDPERPMACAGGVGPAAVRGALGALLLRRRVRVAFTKDVSDTAALLALAAKYAAADAADAAHAAHAAAHAGAGVGEEAAAASSSAAQRSAEAAAVASAVAGSGSRKSAGLDPARCFLQQLCQVPRVSVRIARVLASEFGSMRALYATLGSLSSQERVRRLSALPGIGVKGARTLDHFLMDEPDTA